MVLDKRATDRPSKLKVHHKPLSHKFYLADFRYIYL